MADFKLLMISGLASVLGVFSAMLSAQSFPGDSNELARELAELRREVTSLKQGQKKIQRDLSAVMDILTGRKPPLEDVFVSVAGSPSLGQGDAMVTIVEFTDFQCPFCGEYARETFGRIVSDYVKTTKIRYVIRNFPLNEIHPLARKAAEASLCAEEQGKFWQLHDRFFADQKKLAIGDIPEHAAAIGADGPKLKRCVETGRYAAKVALDLMEGRDMEIGGTPTFFIGYSDVANASRIRAIRSINGNAPYREFQKAIAEALEASRDARVEQ